MNQKKRGFTLIELLAVIVILGIIAVIAVPIIKSITKDAKMKSFMNSARGIIRAGDLYYSRKDMMDEINGDITFEFPNANELEVNGKLPESGTMIINEDGDIALAITNGKYCITKGFEDTDLTVTDDYENCKLILPDKTLSDLATTSSEVTNIPACVNDGTVCAPGTPVAIQVNESNVYNFYVLNENNNKVSLIMDRNLGERILWTSEKDYGCGVEGDYCSLNDLGPITALNYLNTQTSGWTNIPAIKNYKYDNNLNGTTNEYGYQKIEIINGIGKLTSQDGTKTSTLSGTSRARMLTYEETNDIKTSNNNIVPIWLYTNLSYESTATKPYGYWFLTTSPLNNENVIYIDCAGYVFVYDDAPVYLEDFFGVRPIITLSK